MKPGYLERAHEYARRKMFKAGEALARRQIKKFWQQFHTIGYWVSLEQARIDVLEIHPELKPSLPNRSKRLK